MKYIRRLDHNLFHYWVVKFGASPKKGGGKHKWRSNKCFFDGVYGGRENALVAAKKYRDQKVIELREHLPSPVGWTEAWIEKPNGYSYLYIVGYYRNKEGKQIKTMFGTYVCGYDNAMKKMLSWRSKGVRNEC